MVDRPTWFALLPQPYSINICRAFSFLIYSKLNPFFVRVTGSHSPLPIQLLLRRILCRIIPRSTNFVAGTV
ncbi:hypothetical protein L6164_029168 [Bauhinia variegata]|uniref:Uncharacterized protein n=1 Tax=Bauhinia variegata TaxID=167791 RepID=A0ACB9L953_BAUVA|nr:hypothetical protein L6164_029168 [Bauhinia variegata]